MLPAPVTEHRFHETRRWRFDFAWPALRIAVEIEGGLYVRGRHTRPSGFVHDAEKYNAAALAGWVVLRYTPSAIQSASALREIKEALRQAKEWGCVGPARRGPV